MGALAARLGSDHDMAVPPGGCTLGHLKTELENGLGGATRTFTELRPVATLGQEPLEDDSWILPGWTIAFSASDT